MFNTQNIHIYELDEMVDGATTLVWVLTIYATK